jgi:ubiquinone/menaquinone biosynthesis C-methylase UbiE
LAHLLEHAGFSNVRYRLFAGGIVALHVAESPKAKSL